MSSHESESPVTPPLDLAGVPASRRDFLKLAGFSLAAAMVPGCGRGDEHKAVPFMHKPEIVNPGQSQYYATACAGCDAGCGLLVTVRDGRPIKIEGNDLHPLSQGRTCAVGQATILGLYDSHRLTRPALKGNPSDLETIDVEATRALASSKSVRLLTGTINGPTARDTIERFLKTFADGVHVAMDGVPQSALAQAHKNLYGERMVPRYRLENAHVLVALDADFLGTWLAPVEFSRGYHASRSLKASGSFCHHTHFEARVSLTGGNADRRVRVAPAELPLVVAALAERVAKAQGTSTPWGKAPASSVDAKILDETAGRLVNASRGRGLVMCGLDDLTTQSVTAYLNHLLGADDASLSYRTVDLDAASQQAMGDSEAVAKLLGELQSGSIDTLIVAGCNPVYALKDGKALGESLAKVKTVIAVSERMDETASLAHLVCPPPHFLASWDDAEPVRGLLTLSQPTIAPRGTTRQLTESLAAWSGTPATAHAQLRDVWRKKLYARAQTSDTFEAWWHQALHDGFAKVKIDGGARPAFASVPALSVKAAPTGGALALVLYPKIGIRDGQHAHNPWLQELPDPISKVSWLNTADLAPATASKLGVEDGDIVRIKGGDRSIELPVLVQQGQAENVVAIALGYGVKGTDRFTNAGPDWIESTPTVEKGGTVGVRAIALANAASVTLEKTGVQVRLPRTQIYDRLEVPKHLAPKGGEVRPLIQETTYDEYRVDPHAGTLHQHPKAELWEDDHPYKGHHWELAIDLASCTGCSACVVACQSENNIPVVGRDEILRQREMHWLRIDRYFQGSEDDLRVAHQPMMCQQCDHAPCETVCPVLATVHGEEGLNQQAYNRCVGTRYCSNNCPYKVRRFNWFDYAHDDQLENMSLNPDVTVRTRGVMEKCTFCVQRIQGAKAKAAREDGRPLHRDEIQTACMQVCPVDAIIFGDSNDPKSTVSTQAASERAYRALEDLNVQPSVSYLRRIRHRDADEHGAAHGESNGGAHHD